MARKDLVAAGATKGLKKLHDNPEKARKAWAAGLCGFVSKEGQLNNTIEECIGNLMHPDLLSAPPVPKTAPTITGESGKLAGITDGDYDRWGAQGGQIMKTYGKQIAAKTFSALGQGALSKRQKKEQIWGE